MSATPPPKLKVQSLADYLVRYDLATILEDARQDYSQTSSGGPRLMTQNDIAARFRKVRPPVRNPDE